MTQYYFNATPSFFTRIRAIFNSSLRRNLKMKTIGCGDIKWNLLYGDGSKSERRFSVIFYENELNHRGFEITSMASDFSYLARLQEFHNLKLWLASGIKPDFFEDILQKKLKGQ